MNEILAALQDRIKADQPVEFFAHGQFIGSVQMSEAIVISENLCEAGLLEAVWLGQRVSVQNKDIQALIAGAGNGRQN